MTTQVGRYELVAPLRAGGMARIDLARLRGPYDLCRHVVLKRPLPHQATDPAALEQFRVEARLLASIYHPNVISFLEADTDADGVDFFAIEYLHGASVRDLAPPRGDRLARTPSLAAALTIAVEIATGLAHVHGLPGAVVHRDVSPSNVLLGHDGSVKLIDFGVAKLTDGATASGGLRGKISYMAPEQCRGEPLDGRADLYAVGVMLYELVTGRRPFHAADDVASLHKVLAGPPPSPRTVVPELDPELDALVRKAMAFDAAERHASAGALIADLEAYAARRRLSLGAAQISAALAALGPVPPQPWRVPPSPSDVQPPDRWTEKGSDRSDPFPGQPGQAPRASRRIVGIAAAIALAAAGAIAYGALERDEAPAPGPASAPTPTARAASPAAPPVDEPDPGAPADAPSPADEPSPVDEPRPADEPTPAPPTAGAGDVGATASAEPTARPSPPRRARPTPRRPIEKSPAPVTPPIDAAPAPRPAGKPGQPAPEWKPDLFLPGDRR